MYDQSFFFNDEFRKINFGNCEKNVLFFFILNNVLKTREISDSVYIIYSVDNFRIVMGNYSLKRKWNRYLNEVINAMLENLTPLSAHLPKFLFYSKDHSPSSFSSLPIQYKISLSLSLFSYKIKLSQRNFF